MWWIIFYTALKRNGWRQFFFYLSNLDISRFIEFSKITEFLKGRRGVILELGCGYSVLPALLSGSSENYICLDLSKGACKYQAPLPNVSTVMADMQYLPFKSEVIPTILAISSIEHVPDDKLVFKEISRIASKDGDVFISVPYSNCGVKIKKMERSKFLLYILYRFRKFWAIVLGKHLNYFLEQTSTDSFMKFYNIIELKGLMESNSFYIINYYLYEKWLQQKFFRIIPKGWFILKDLFIGWILWCVEDIFSSKRFENFSSRGIVIHSRKINNDFLKK